MRIVALLLTPALFIAAPALAQTTSPSESPDAPRTPLPYDRGYDKPSARTDAINESSRADVAAANNDVAAASAAQPAGVDQARYEADLVEYRAALAGRDRAIAVDAAVVAKQERAYADAMTAWRIQVADCRRGITAACRAPTPRPADFY